MKADGTAVIIFLVLMGAVTADTSYAQTPISLQASIDTALKNNLLLKNEQLYAGQQQRLIKTSREIPPTSVFAEAGQINSSYTDTKFGLSQSISFPVVYIRQKTLLTEQYQGSKIAVAVKGAELKKQVSNLYNSFSHLQQKRKLLAEIDSIYSEFLKIANLRFQKGESNVLEKATAENQQGQIAVQLRQLEVDIDVAQLQFQQLLGTAELFTPVEGSFGRMAFSTAASVPEQNPRIQYLQQQKQIAAAHTQWLRSKLAPDLILGYNNNSFRGNGADNEFYNASDRFHSVQLGLGIPIFNRAQKARIDASKIEEAMANNSYLHGLRTLQSERETALLTYQKISQTAGWYEETAIKAAQTISSTATKQFVNGDINYLEWVMLINQSATIKSQYLDVIKSLNEAINQLNYLSNK